MDRIRAIDFIKCIAMIMIVSGHAGVSIIKGIAPVHVALFFVCSGVLLNSNLKFSELLCRNIKKLYIPFVGFSVVFIIFHNCIEDGWKYTSKQHYYLVLKHTFLMDVTEPLLGPMWFLTALFLATTFWGGAKILSEIIDQSRKITPINLRQILCIIMLLLGINWTIDGVSVTGSFMNPQIVNTSLVVTFFIELGYIFRKYYKVCSPKWYIISGILSWVCEILLLIWKKITPNVRENEWGDLLLYVLFLILAWHFLYVLGSYITKIDPLYKIICIIGKNTLWIMALHMFCLKIFAGLTCNSEYLLYGYVKVIGAMLIPILLHGCYDVIKKFIINGNDIVK